jgi:LPS-assembly protein
MARAAALALGALAPAALLAAAPADAQMAALSHSVPVNAKAPFTFSADQVEYNRDKNLMIAKGHVEAWQNGVVLEADEVTYNRATGEATAHGHVVLMEPDGEVLFADYAELGRNFDTGLFDDPRALLPGNGRLAGNGGIRSGNGQIDTLSRAVYSTCNLCKGHPDRAPLWQLRARKVVDDEQHQRLDYTDAELQFFGVPSAWFPYFSTPTPSARRQTGLLVPTFGINSHLGGFFAQPYYWVIDNRSDATFTPMITTRAGEELSVQYRRAFNDGFVNLNVSGAYTQGQPQGLVNLNGVFDLNETWRAGFHVQRASSTTYVTNFQLSNFLGGEPTVLPSTAYLEGFGEGAYARLDTRLYQSVNTSVAQSLLPEVLPRFEYSYFGQPDLLGGRLSLSTEDFNVVRETGTNTRRSSLSLDWSRPFTGELGDKWTFRLHADAAAYSATEFTEQPNFADRNSVDDARAYPAAEVDWRWPFQRDSGSWGTQVIEPIAQVVVSPAEGNGQLNLYPNEDSYNMFNFTDQNLFSLHRLGGIDELEGGDRATWALHGAWYLGNVAFDGLLGQSYRSTKDTWLPEWTGLRDQVSDVVARATLSPAPWLDLTYRTRLNHQTFRSDYSEIVSAVGVPKFNMSAGYIYSPYDPYYFFDQASPPPPGSLYYTPRNEITLGASTKWGYYKVSGFARRDVATNQMVSAGGDLVYEDECFIADLRFIRQFTTYNGNTGSTTLLLQFTLKTVGTFGFHAF